MVEKGKRSEAEEEDFRLLLGKEGRVEVALRSFLMAGGSRGSERGRSWGMRRPARCVRVTSIGQGRVRTGSRSPNGSVRVFPPTKSIGFDGMSKLLWCALSSSSFSFAVGPTLQI